MTYQPRIKSAAIRRAIEIASEAGNDVKVVPADWRPKQVVFMAEPLSAEAKAAILRELPELDYFASKATPHNPADEGFRSAADDVVLSFPTARGRALVLSESGGRGGEI